MSASSTVKPHIQSAGTAAARAPSAVQAASSRPGRCPRSCMLCRKVRPSVRVFLRFVSPDRMPFEIVVAKGPSRSEDGTFLSPARAEGDAGPRRERRHARDVLGVFIDGGDGVNLSARVKETHGAFVLRDLALALVDLARRPSSKAAVRFYDEPWELCVERFDAVACLSVYRTGPDPLVMVYDRAVPFADVVSAAREAIERVLGSGEARPGVRLELASAIEQLDAAGPTAHAECHAADPLPER